MSDASRFELGKAYRLKYMRDAIIVVREIRDCRSVLCSVVGTLYGTSGEMPFDSLKGPIELIAEEVGEEYVQTPFAEETLMDLLRKAKERFVEELDFDSAAFVRQLQDELKKRPTA